MILSDPFAPPPAPPRSRLRRAWDRMAGIALTPVAWLVGLVGILAILKGGFGK